MLSGLKSKDGRYEFLPGRNVPDRKTWAAGLLIVALGVVLLVLDSGRIQLPTRAGAIPLSNPEPEFEAFTLKAGAPVKLRIKGGRNNTAYLYWDSGVGIWNDDGDEAVLLNSEGDGMDRYLYLP